MKFSFYSPTLPQAMIILEKQTEEIARLKGEIRGLREALAVDDDMIDRLLRARYPGEWPDDKIFDKVFPGGTETFRELCLRDARNELEAALNQGEPKQ